MKFPQINTNMKNAIFYNRKYCLYILKYFYLGMCLLDNFDWKSADWRHSVAEYWYCTLTLEMYCM